MSIRPRPKSSRLPRLRALRALRPRLPKSKDKTVRVMFHGTSALAASNICRHGMDPSKRLSGGDWFTEDPNYALSRAISGGGHHLIGERDVSAPPRLRQPSTPFRQRRRTASGSVRMLAVAVLLDESTKIGDHVVCKNHHHALPLFVMDFRRLPGDRATSAS